MTRSQLGLVVTLPWLAAGVVLLAMTRIQGETRQAQLGLFGSAAICFSIGCLARTSLGLHDLTQDHSTAPPPVAPPAAPPGASGGARQP
ncbi:hypothetical protein KBY84_00785 [Cyanobium sp. N.Huapi 1H5]|uniref:hypothetical protein n=1 Tax=Cyanobium sp. N.Huapi 1H5 TaxID=2823719 RepID=UPI0020CF567E|nr:hypothetical protein [Cyanobium sp. N.Huapi 1H5]MCP9836023.1 hypothetical protein [Cyanobium sp. N.Huapi 1H5]